MNARQMSLFIVVALVTGMALPTFAKPSRERLLQQAYQKEFAYLNSTKRQLQERIKAIETEMAKDADTSIQELAVLEQALLADQTRADGLERELSRATMAADAKAELDVDDLLQQVETELGKVGALAPASAQDDPLKALDAALLTLHAAHAVQGQLRQSEGVFFDTQGKKLEGQIVRLGGIAAWGVSDGRVGPLAPAGSGAFKLWPQSTGDGVNAFLKGEAPAMVDTFLFASEAHAVDMKKEKKPLEIVKAGGAVAWVIVGIGAFAALLIALRVLLLIGMGRGRRSLNESVLCLVRSSQSSAAVRVCRERGGALGSLLTTAVQSTALPREARVEVLEEALLRVLPKADRFGAMIIVLAAASPLLGLLGTVSGMISTFDVITEHGTGDPRMLSGGISEALITTELGLIVAIPALFFGNVLMGWGERLKRDLEASALSVAYAEDLETMTRSTGLSVAYSEEIQLAAEAEAA